MDLIIELLTKTLAQVWHTLSVNWIFLLASAVIAAALKLYVDQDRLAAFLQRNRKAGVVIATGAAVGTPLCSCGTTAVSSLARSRSAMATTSCSEFCK